MACLGGCTLIQASTGTRVLILQPKINPGAVTQTVINPYTKADINHLTLMIYTVNGGETYTGISRTIPNADLGAAIAISSLKANTHYRIKALAYSSSDDSVLISTSDASSYTDVTLTNNDSPTVTPLNVKLINKTFNGQVTDPLNIVNGGYDQSIPEKISFSYPYVVSSLAGGFSACGVAVDTQGYVYVADTQNNRICKVTPGGVMSVLAGNGGTVFSDGTGTAAGFNIPRGIAVDSTGNVYVADWGNYRIRKITPTGVVSTIAGNGTSSSTDGTGSAATFPATWGLALDATGNIYVGDWGGSRIRKITPSRVVTTLVTGISAAGITVDAAGNLYVADYGARIRKVTPGGVMTTLAGNGTEGFADGPSSSARFKNPTGIASDPQGNLFVADLNNQRIRKIDTSGVVTTLAGNGTAVVTNGIGSAAQFYSPYGIAIDSQGNLYVADLGGYIRKMQ